MTMVWKYPLELGGHLTGSMTKDNQSPSEANRVGTYGLLPIHDWLSR